MGVGEGDSWVAVLWLAAAVVLVFGHWPLAVVLAALALVAGR